MEDDSETVETIPFYSIRFRIEVRDRGSYAMLLLYSSDLVDPVGSFHFSKSDPHYQSKLNAIKSVIGWLNESIITGKNA
jgi:hypothetical protein